MLVVTVHVTGYVATITVGGFPFTAAGFDD